MVTLESYAHAIIQLSSDGVVSKDVLTLMASVGVPELAEKTGFRWDEKAYKSFESTMKMFGKAESVKDGVKYDVAYLQSMSGFGPGFSQYMFWKELMKEIKANNGVFDAVIFIKKLNDSYLGMFFDLSDDVTSVMSEGDFVAEDKKVSIGKSDSKTTSKSIRKPKTSKTKINKEGASKNEGKNQE